jgi:hypothetical protein
MMKKFFRSMSDFHDVLFGFHLLRERFVGSDVRSERFQQPSWMKHPEVAEELVGHLRGGHDKTDWDRLVPTISL